MMNESHAVAGAVLALLAASSAFAADICKQAAAHGPANYCVTSTFSDRVNDEYNLVLGPGNALSGTGIPGTNTQGFTVTGTFSCPGDNFISAADTSNQGDNVVLYGRFSPARPAMAHGFDSFNGLVFAAELTPGACQAPPHAKTATTH